MSRTYTIKVDEVCRVEGHGNIQVAVKNGKIEYVKMGVDEGARLFEALLVGRKFDEAAKISCRICAICSATIPAAKSSPPTQPGNSAISASAACSGAS